MNFVTIRNRKEITIDDVEMLDFTSQVIVVKKQLTFSRPPITVSEEFAGRPDLISKLVYGSEDHTDLLLFFNGFSNPFMVDAGMTMIIPDLDSMLANVVDKTKEDEDNKSKEAFNKKLPKKDADRVKKLISKATGVSVEEAQVKPPNIPEDGTQPTTPQDGAIILGTNVVDRCESQLSDAQKLSERVREAVRSKISAINAVGSPIRISKNLKKVSQQFNRDFPIAEPRNEGENS